VYDNLVCILLVEPACLQLDIAVTYLVRYPCVRQCVPACLGRNLIKHDSLLILLGTNADLDGTNIARKNHLTNFKALSNLKVTFKLIFGWTLYST